MMAFKIFSTGTVIDSAWLNDVNQAVYNTLPGKVSSNSPVLITPNIGNATATTVNGITFTQSSGTLTIPNGTTATVSGVNTGDQNLTNYAQFNGVNAWTGNNTFTANVALNTASANKLVTKIVYNIALFGNPTAGNLVLDATGASTYGLVVTGNLNISIINPPQPGTDQTLYIKLVNGGAYTVTWASGIRFPGGVPPALSSGGGQDLLSAWYDPFFSSWVVGMIWKDMK